MSALALLRATASHTHRARRHLRRVPVSRKDFGTLPVCGSVRPLASQRTRVLQDG